MPLIIGATPKLNGIDSANIRDSLKPIDDLLVAMADAGGGLVRVPGSLDVDWVAVAAAARPAVNTPYAGGRTFRFDDDLQATKPLFIRFRYGHGQTNTPSLFFQLGTGVAADGTLTGQVTALKELNYAVAVNGPFPLWLSMGPNFISFVTRAIPTSLTPTGVVIVERMRDEAGVETEEGAIALFAGAGSAATTQRGRVLCFPFTGAVPADALGQDHLTQIGGMSGLTSNATDLVLAPVMVPYNGKWRYMTALVYRVADIADGSTFDLQHMGDIRQYIAIGTLGGQWWGTTTNLQSILMRWE